MYAKSLKNGSIFLTVLPISPLKMRIMSLI